MSEEIKEFQQQLGTLRSMSRREKTLAVTQYLEKQRNERIEQQIEEKYGVKTSYE